MSQHILAAALAYRKLGFSLIPVRRANKLPARRWTKYQTERASDAQVRKWFSGPDNYGIGVVFGPVSGNLASRDFDDVVTYERWAAKHTRLARELPTVETSRGRHVYCRTAPDDLLSVRERIGKPDAVGAIAIENGELRAGCGCFSVLPPSKHPSGKGYQWLIPPMADIPLVRLDDTGFVDGLCRVTERTEEYREDQEHRDHERTQMNTDEIIKSGLFPEAIEKAIVSSLPQKLGQRHRHVFELARALKSVPQLADAAPKELKPFVRYWHKAALHVIGTEPFEETWIDFLRGWPKVKFPKGSEPMTLIFERASGAETPQVALAYQQPKLRLLVALCRELQQEAGDGPFYLSCRTAGELLEVTHVSASRWLFLLEQDEILKCVTKGSQEKRQASRFKYLAPL